ncbi:unnamed protein product, partial [marine sediment metagenome]
DIAVTHEVDPFVSAYPWTPGAGFGAKYGDPVAKPAGAGWGVAFCGSTDIAVAHSTDPRVSAYPWTPGAGFGAKYGDPAIKPAGDGNGVAFMVEEEPPPVGIENKSANMGSKMVAAGLI